MNYKLADISIKKIIYLLSKQLVKIYLLGMLIFTILFRVYSEFIIIIFFIHYSLIFIGGLWGSFIIHELSHLLSLKRLYPNEEIQVKVTLLNFRILPQFRPGKKENIFVAISGPLICVLLGLLINLISKAINNSALQIISYLYFLQGVFVLPPFSDGMEIIRVFLHKEGESDE